MALLTPDKVSHNIAESPNLGSEYDLQRPGLYLTISLDRRHHPQWNLHGL